MKESNRPKTKPLKLNDTKAYKKTARFCGRFRSLCAQVGAEVEPKVSFQLKITAF